MAQPNLLITLTFLALSSTAFAKGTSYKAPALPEISKNEFLTDAEYKKLIETSKNALNTRKIAGADRVDYATAIEDDHKNLTAELVGGKRWVNHQEGGTETASRPDYGDY